MEQTHLAEKGKAKAFWKKGHLNWAFKERVGILQTSKGGKRTPGKWKSIYKKE